jgi:hypothetical protein
MLNLWVEMNTPKSVQPLALIVGWTRHTASGTVVSRGTKTPKSFGLN